MFLKGLVELWSGRLNALFGRRSRITNACVLKDLKPCRASLHIIFSIAQLYIAYSNVHLSIKLLRACSEEARLDYFSRGRDRSNRSSAVQGRLEADMTQPSLWI